MSEIKLLPCPFCGGEVKTFHIPPNDIKEILKHPNWQWQHPNMWVVGCETEMCMGNINHFAMVFVDEQSAIKTWNTRKPMERIIERIESFPHGDFNVETMEELIEIIKEEGGIE